MKVKLGVLILLQVACGRLSNKIDPDLMQTAYQDSPAAGNLEPAVMEPRHPSATDEAANSRLPSAAEDQMDTKPAESDDTRDCQRFLTTADPAPSSELKRSMLGRFQVAVEWSKVLTAAELNNEARLRFFDSMLKPIPLQLKSFKLFMPSMNHGSIKLDKLIFTQNPEALNEWQVAQIYFSMGGNVGEWVVDIEAGLCGETDRIRVSIEQAVMEPE